MADAMPGFALSVAGAPLSVLGCVGGPVVDFCTVFRYAPFAQVVVVDLPVLGADADVLACAGLLFDLAAGFAVAHLPGASVDVPQFAKGVRLSSDKCVLWPTGRIAHFARIAFLRITVPRAIRTFAARSGHLWVVALTGWAASVAGEWVMIVWTLARHDVLHACTALARVYLAACVCTKGEARFGLVVWRRPQCVPSGGVTLPAFGVGVNHRGGPGIAWVEALPVRGRWRPRVAEVVHQSPLAAPCWSAALDASLSTEATGVRGTWGVAV